MKGLLKNMNTLKVCTLDNQFPHICLHYSIHCFCGLIYLFVHYLYWQFYVSVCVVCICFFVKGGLSILVTIEEAITSIGGKP